MSGEDKDIKEYLARIRKTIEDSKSLVAQAELRIAETDRMLERQGLTREQVLAMKFDEAQIAAANAELKRRGLDPLPELEGGWEPSYEPPRAPFAPYQTGADSADDLENRHKKFGMMMKPFQI